MVITQFLFMMKVTSLNISIIYFQWEQNLFRIKNYYSYIITSKTDFLTVELTFFLILIHYSTVVVGKVFRFNSSKFEADMGFFPHLYKTCTCNSFKNADQHFVHPFNKTSRVDLGGLNTVDWYNNASPVILFPLGGATDVLLIANMPLFIKNRHGISTTLLFEVPGNLCHHWHG